MFFSELPFSKFGMSSPQHLPFGNGIAGRRRKNSTPGIFKNIGAPLARSTILGKGHSVSFSSFPWSGTGRQRNTNLAPQASVRVESRPKSWTGKNI